MNDRCLRVLLVEDDEDDYLIVRSLLSEIKGSRFDLEWVKTYEAALEAIRHGHHDVCLVDYRLGGPHNGLEVIHWVNGNDPARMNGNGNGGAKGCRPPMILLTGRGDHEVDVAAMRAGAADYMVKGQIDATLLERSIRYAVERAENIQKLKEAHRNLIQSEKLASLGQLSVGMAHEIKNALGFTMSNLSLLTEHFEVFKQALAEYETLVAAVQAGDADGRRNALDRIDGIYCEGNLSHLREEAGQLLEESREGMDRIMELVKALKNFSRPDESQLKEADVNEGIEEALKIVRCEIKHKCRIQTDLGKIPPVRCYPAWLNQVFMNLLVNAAQAIPEQGEITIRTQVTDNHVVVRVGDTGSGIPEAIRGHIFEPFFTTKPPGEGTGLGLTISHSIVQAHKGSIEVRSKEGEGTEFVVKIPLGLEGGGVT